MTLEKAYAIYQALKAVEAQLSETQQPQLYQNVHSAVLSAQGLVNQLSALPS